MGENLFFIIIEPNHRYYNHIGCSIEGFTFISYTDEKNQRKLLEIKTPKQKEVNFIDLKEFSQLPNQRNYCYSSDGKSCPYLKVSKDHDDQENGYCTLLNLKDWVDDTLLWDAVNSCSWDREIAEKEVDFIRKKINKKFFIESLKT